MKFFVLPIVFAALLQADQGRFTIHMIQHLVGEERYDISPSAGGGMALNTVLEYTDRANQRTASATLRMKRRLHAAGTFGERDAG